ncbi:MAG: M48 family metallopeptidase [Muribaculum sp.]|nr:M48 family metallopeptidase [Muribaculum sp.]
MKNIIFHIRHIALAIAMVCVSVNSYADLNWGRLLNAAVNTIQATSITDEQVAAYVHQSIQAQDKQNKMLPLTDPLSQRLTKLTQGLDAVDGVPLNFRVYDEDIVNAFACADGSVRVYSGLMQVMDDDELLGVIGHEIGHVAHHDTRNAFKHALLTTAAIQGLTSGSNTLAILSDSQLGALGQKLLSANYSKKQESNADDYGYDFLKAHGKNPVAMIKAFKKLKQLEESSGSGSMSGLAQMFSSHPDIDKRIKNMTKRARKDGYIR